MKIMKMTTTRVLFSLAMGSLVFGSGLAGSLEPPVTPPAPTMVTIQQVHDAVTRPPDTCFTVVGRFSDCGNGTVKDNLTQMFWLKNATCLGVKSWADANIAAAQLGQGTPGGIACNLTDGSKPGDWRLPTLQCPSGTTCSVTTPPTGEFASIFAPSCPGSSLYLYANDGISCSANGDPFYSVQPSAYWALTTLASHPPYAWAVTLGSGNLGTGAKSQALNVWAVRGGQ